MRLAVAGGAALFDRTLVILLRRQMLRGVRRSLVLPPRRARPAAVWQRRGAHWRWRNDRDGTITLLLPVMAWRRRTELVPAALRLSHMGMVPRCRVALCRLCFARGAWERHAFRLAAAFHHRLANHRWLSSAATPWGRRGVDAVHEACKTWAPGFPKHLAWAMTKDLGRHAEK